ncbi:hypothetical protein RAD15_02330 [Bradyrhizobium sp. 14AA]
MISAREFCKEPGYPVTIFLTYAFDPLFFERIPIEDLGIGGTRRILVMGDASELSGAMQRCAGQIFHLGRKYTLAEARPSNLFHPKMIARLSPEGGKVWIGSGNLTYTGWGGNHELAVAWPIGADSEDNGAWLFDILRSVASLTGSESFRAQIEDLGASFPWLRRAPVETAPPHVLLGMPGRPLAPQLARRWDGRRFATLSMYTGSTDVDGAFLRWAHDTFGAKEATICVTPSFASFDAKQLAKLPLKVRFVERDPKRRVHAKFCWFSGPDGDAAVMGSANCSAAAWLANHANGNVELITVYDTPDRAAFAPLLADFDGEKRLPEDVLKAPVKPELPGDEGDGLVFRLTSLRLRESGRAIEAIVDPVPDQDSATLVFEVGRKTFRVAMRRSGGRYSGRLTEEMSLGAETVFGRIEILVGPDVSVTQSRWLDNDRAIENGARGRETNSNHGVFSGRGFAGASEQRIMEAIYSISTSLFNFETPDLSELGSERRGPNEKESGSDEDDEAAGPVDPSKLTYRLSDRAAKSGTSGHGQHNMHGVSLSGVMKFLFSPDDEPEVDLSQERWSAEEPEKYEDNATSAGLRPGASPPTPQPPVPRSDAEAATALREQIDTFLFGLAKPSFAEKCPPTALAQALAFPILLGTKGVEEGWFQEDALASIAYRVVQIMFAKPYGPGKPKGLFRQVQARYATGEPREEFLKCVGDGALHTVLSAALAKPDAKSLAALVQQADAISQVERCTDLVTTAHPDQKASLSQNVIIRGASFAINERAPALAQAMTKLTSWLQQWERVNPGRAGRSSMHKAGTVLWMPHGWEVLPRSPAETYCGGVNLESVSMDAPEIKSALEALWSAMRLGRAEGHSLAKEHLAQANK